MTIKLTDSIIKADMTAVTDAKYCISINERRRLHKKWFIPNLAKLGGIVNQDEFRTE